MNASANPIDAVLGPAGPPFRLEIPLRFRRAGADAFILAPDEAILRASLEPFEILRVAGRLAPRLLGVDLRSYPTTPRIHILDPADPNSATPVWQTAGEVGKGVPATAGAVDAGPDLAKALARLLDRRLATLRDEGAEIPEELEMRLAVESDAPCRFLLSRLVVPYRLRRVRLVSGKEKEVLRFPGGRVATAAVALTLPRDARVHGASLRTAEGARGHRPEGGGFSALVSRSGARLAGETWAAQRLDLASPLTATGLATAVLPLAAGTEIAFELQADAGGRPAGETLAEATIRLGEPGRAAWSIARLPRPSALPAGISWLLVRATRSAAVWLTEEGTAPLLLLTRSGPRRIWRDAGALPGRSALWRLLAPAALAGSEDAAFTLTVAGEPVEPSAREDFTDFDLTGPLTAALAAAFTAVPPGEGLLEIPLAFASPAATSLTVYPPEVDYEIGG